MRKELGEFLTTKGVAARKRTKYYKREGNSQPERNNSMIWRRMIMGLLTIIPAAVFISVRVYLLTLAEFVKTALVGNSTLQRLIAFS